MTGSFRTMPAATEADGRLVVVNLDPGWPFAALVRRFALDLYGRGITGAVEFRTIGGERGRRDQDSLVWGTRWPRMYGNDTEALLADLFEDLALLHEGRLRDLTVVMVLPHPAEAPHVTEEALALGRRFAERLATVPQVLQNLGRYVAVRDASHVPENVVRAALGSMGERFLTDPERRGGQPFDSIALLLQPRVRNDAEEVHARQFILLRCLLEIMGRSHERSSGERSGTAKEAVAAARRDLRGRIVALDLEGNHPILSSERLGELLNAFYGQAANQPATGGDPVGDGGADAPNNDEETQVDTILQVIGEEVQAREQEIAPPRPAPQSWNRYLDDATYWSAELEKRFADELRDDLDTLEEWSKTSLQTLEQRKMSLHQTVTLTREQKVREMIGRLTFVNAGLSGEAAQALKRMKDKVWSKRADLLAMASDSRAKLLFVRIASETTMAATPQAEVPVDRLALRNMQEYADYRNAAKKAQTSLRRLVPRGYLVLAWLVPAAALGTIVAHGAARATMQQARFLDTLLLNGWPILPIAWALATAMGFLLVRRVIRARRNALREAIDDLQKARGRLAESVHLAMKAALNYVILTSRIPWLDLLHQELDRRGAENDQGAYARALALVRPRAHRKVRLFPDEERHFHSRHQKDVAGLRVTRWLPGILVKTDPSADLRPAPLEFALGADGSRFTLDATVFLDETKVLLTDVTSDEVTHVT